MSSEKRLRGGPFDGATRMWTPGMTLRVAHACPDGGLGSDVSQYDRDGNYEWSEHPGDRRYEPCGQCDLCPGHLVETTPAERYQWSDR